ncbi:MAG: glycosyltransferase family 9 protein [Candidatus Omnitrophota bacterium]
MITVTKKVLIVKLNRLGDTVCFLPSINIIRKAWSQAHLTLLTTNIGEELIEGSKLVDEVWICGIEELKTLSGFWQWLKIVRKNKFDIAIASSDSSSFVSLLFYLSSIPLRVGFTNPKLSFLFNQKIPFSAKITHLELNLQIAKRLGLPFDRDRLYPCITIPEKDETELLDKISNNRKLPDVSFVVLHVCSNRPSHTWFTERYVEVVRFLAEKYSMKIVCIGGKKEKELVSSLRKLVNNQHIIDLCSETNVKQLIHVISLAKLFIGHSSGPLHVAYMLGIPTVSLWGASSLAIWGPVFDKEKHICIKADLDCLHCEQIVCPKGTLECMKLIKADRVIGEISKLLERNSGKN